jgi:hypothetical protein
MPFKALMGTIKIWEACACRGNMGTIKGFSNIYCSGGWQQLGIGRYKLKSSSLGSGCSLIVAGKSSICFCFESETVKFILAELVIYF